MTSHAAPLPARRSRPHINRTVLREQIKELLLERILGGAYQPGDRLVEMQLAQELGTSQALVREALRELEALGFVASEPFRLAARDPEQAGTLLRRHIAYFGKLILEGERR